MGKEQAEEARIDSLRTISLHTGGRRDSGVERGRVEDWGQNGREGRQGQWEPRAGDTSERGGQGTVTSGDCGEISGVSQGPRNAGGAGMHSTARHIPCCVGALTANCDSVR